MKDYILQKEETRRSKELLQQTMRQSKFSNLLSSVAREEGAGGYSLPIGMSTKQQNKKNTTFLALMRLFYALEWTK